MIDKSLLQRLSAECIGTAILLATVIGSGIMGDRLAGENEAIALLANTIATGAILYVLITMLGHISGAHFNPAVTLVFWIKKDIKTYDASLYVIVQIAGGLIGMLLAHAMFEESLFQLSTRERTGAAQWLSECIATFGLITTILLTFKAHPPAVPAAVGFYITAAYWFTASTSFANPAVTIARSFTDTFSGIAIHHAPAFITAQCIGAVIALLYCTWQLQEEKDTP